jgi:hypothetical protein
MCRGPDGLGGESVDTVCEYLAKKHGFKLKEIDIILWKYARDLGVDDADCTKRQNVQKLR